MLYDIWDALGVRNEDCLRTPEYVAELVRFYHHCHASHSLPDVCCPYTFMEEHHG